ncbi:hypothetical protein K432DRAFT_396901 [Lepidopterella palustris CBS 459.81]|uniref:Uncharacterized protein n=1 Tax=Lepidopterella palustris CBS 459.81 TaxID=1314670 RepID=A0A8E2JBH1_9PEZI|nr:hypothetical protein K432DRAFT_396901 [Lepidopterella palustris CBS 459.81]
MQPTSRDFNRGQWDALPSPDGDASSDAPSPDEVRWDALPSPIPNKNVQALYHLIDLRMLLNSRATTQTRIGQRYINVYTRSNFYIHDVHRIPLDTWFIATVNTFKIFEMPEYRVNGLDRVCRLECNVGAKCRLGEIEVFILENIEIMGESCSRLRRSQWDIAEKQTYSAVVEGYDVYLWHPETV